MWRIKSGQLTERTETSYNSEPQNGGSIAPNVYPIFWCGWGSDEGSLRGIILGVQWLQSLPQPRASYDYNNAFNIKWSVCNIMYLADVALW